jgi:enoyl-CoA hydratase
MEYQTIQFERKGSIGVIRLNRPHRMNAVIEEMYLDIRATIESARTGSFRCLILTGSALERDGQVKQAFCAGADLKKHSTGERTPAQKRRYIELAHETTREIFEFPRPIIAAVNGPARGAGTELALACDFLLMADDATLAFPETGLGTFVGGGVTCILPRLVGLARAKELVYTGRVISGKEAAAIGLALRCCPLEALLDEAMSLACELAAKAPVSMGFAKRYLQRSPDHDLESVLQLEANAILACMDTEDWREGLRAFNEHRPPHYEGR